MTHCQYVQCLCRSFSPKQDHPGICRVCGHTVEFHKGAHIPRLVANA